MGLGHRWRPPALDLTHLRDCCSKACSLCQVFSQLPNHTVYFLVLWPNSFSSKNHWQNTVTSCSLDLYPLVAWCEGCVLFYPLPWPLLSSLWMLYYRVPLRCDIPHKSPSAPVQLCKWALARVSPYLNCQICDTPFTAAEQLGPPAPARTQRGHSFPEGTAHPGKCPGAAQLSAAV